MFPFRNYEGCKTGTPHLNFMFHLQETKEKREKINYPRKYYFQFRI